MDIVDQEKRSWMMSRIKGRDTKPEMLIRKALHRRGFRFRLHVKALPGKPDIVLKKYKAAVFVHGCFWHRHQGCSNATTPSSNTALWKAKFAANVERDFRNQRNLQEDGWRVAIVWECAIRASLDRTTEALENWLLE